MSTAGMSWLVTWLRVWWRSVAGVGRVEAVACFSRSYSVASFLVFDFVEVWVGWRVMASAIVAGH